jgi:hypothetical protein
MSTTPCKKVTAVTKLGYASTGAALFVVLGLPWTYKLVNKLFGKGHNVIVNAQGTPTTVGVIVHAVVFLLITFLFMQPWKTSKKN